MSQRDRDAERVQDEDADERLVRDALRALPDPGPLPADVAARLDAALGALAPADVERGAAGPVTVLPRRAPAVAREPARGRWLVAAAAAAAVVLAGGGFLLSRTGDDAGSSSAASGGASVDRRQSPGIAAGDGVGAPVYASGTRYTKSDLQVDAQRLLHPVSGRREATAATGPLATRSGLAACVTALGGDAGAALAVDLATYEGRPAAVLVLRGPKGQEVWVVSRTCRPGADGTQAFLQLR